MTSLGSQAALAQPCRAECGRPPMLDDVSVSGDDPLEVPPQDLLERALEGRTI